MSILNTAEFSIFGIELSKKEADSKKIKLKQESYANVQKKYDDFCLAQTHSEKIMPPIPETQPTNQEETIIIHIKNILQTYIQNFTIFMLIKLKIK